MKKKIELNKKTIKRLQLKLAQKNDRKAAPAVVSPDMEYELIPTNGNCDTSHPIWACF